MIIELTNNLRKLTASLGEAKHRKASGLFKAEGTKCVLDTISHFRCRYLIATDKWLALHGSAVTAESVVKATARDMERMSSLSTAPDVIAVYEIPVHTPDFGAFASQLCLALDCIQDPGNLGTIIRTADWFGVRNIICSHTTADVYNPKVVQATMAPYRVSPFTIATLPRPCHCSRPTAMYGFSAHFSEATISITPSCPPTALS